MCDRKADPFFIFDKQHEYFEVMIDHPSYKTFFIQTDWFKTWILMSGNFLTAHVLQAMLKMFFLWYENYSISQMFELLDEEYHYEEFYTENSILVACKVDSTLAPDWCICIWSFSLFTLLYKKTLCFLIML